MNKANSPDFHKFGGESSLPEMSLTGEGGIKVHKAVGDPTHCTLSINVPC